MSRFVKKGNKVGISGRIETGSYKNRDGGTVYTTEVVVENFEFLEPKRDARPAEKPLPEFGDLPDSFEAVDDDIPF